MLVLNVVKVYHVCVVGVSRMWKSIASVPDHSRLTLKLNKTKNCKVLTQFCCSFLVTRSLTLLP